MLTDLSFLAPGARFPPESEHERLDMYSTNRALFEGCHAEVYEQQLKRIDRVIGNFSEVVNFAVVLNFQKLMSLKIADLLLGEPPKITVGDPGSPEQAAADWIFERSDLYNTAYTVAIDVSRYGDGLIYVRKSDQGYGVIDITQPSIWFPVVSPDNVKQVVNQVLAWTYETNEHDQKRKWLKAQVHYRGYYDQLLYSLDEGRIDKLLESARVQTGLNDFAVIQVSNVTTSDRITGIDDYTDIDSIVSELMVRIGQIDRILDKHASPSMAGPSSALERDLITGEWRLKAGSYFVTDNDAGGASPVSYLTWDGQMAASFQQIEKLTNLLYTISEMGSAIFGEVSASNGAPSGTALRRMMVSPLAKVNRIRMRFNQALKKAIDLCSQLGGPNIVSLANTDISITWQDGLPGDPVEEANIMAVRTANKATMSQKRALMVYDGMSETDADAEMDQILSEEMQSSPIAVPQIGGEVNAAADIEGGPNA